jgi:hypothetical protein
LKVFKNLTKLPLFFKFQNIIYKYNNFSRNIKTLDLKQFFITRVNRINVAHCQNNLGSFSLSRRRHMFLHSLLRLLSFISIFALLVFAQSSIAECSDSKVKKLARQGKTISSIAHTCDMDKEDVQSVLDDDPPVNDPDPVDDEGYPPGTPLSECGCWGFIDPNAIQSQPLCASGQAKPKRCNFGCPAGGYAWRGVCI